MSSRCPRLNVRSAMSYGPGWLILASAPWQRLPYLDPGLPLELLPAGWSGVIAGHLFAEMNEQLNEAAMRHAVSLIHP